MQGCILCAAVLASTLAFSFHFTSFLHAKEAVLAVALVAFAAVALRTGAPKIGALQALGPLWLLLAVAAAVHLALWPCHVPADAVVELARWAVLLLVGAFSFEVLSAPAWRRRVTDTVVFAGCAAGALAILQYGGLLSGLFPAFPARAQPAYSVFGNPDLLGAYMALVLPLLAQRMRHAGGRAAVLAWIGAAVASAALLISGCRSAWIAAGVGLALAWCFKDDESQAASCPDLRGRRRRGAAFVLALGAALATVIWLAPSTTIERARHSFTAHDVGVRARLWFWDGTLRMIRDHAILGVGPGNYAYWSPRYLGEALHGRYGERHFRNELLTEHPHSEPLQLAAEWGGAGVACVLWMLWRLARRPGPEWAPLGALLTFALFNAPLHSAPHALAGILLASMLIAQDEEGRGRGSGRRVAALPAFALVLAAIVAGTVAVPSLRLRAAEDLHVAGAPSFAAYARAVAYPWPHAPASEKYGIALFEARRYAEAKVQLTEALAGLDTGGVHFLLGIIAVRQGEPAAARGHIEACLYRWPSCQEALRLRSQLATPP